jgi:hypothetical protein
LPFLLVRKMPRQALGIANAIAAGPMLGASFRLTYEGLSGGNALWRTVLGAVAGLTLIVLSRRLIGERDNLRFAELLPEAMESSPPRLVAVVTSLSLLAMPLIQVLLRV